MMTTCSVAAADMEVLRVINEPTAAALAYGLHKKQGVDYVLVVDLGGGTLDVSLLNIQGGMFLTQGMAGRYPTLSSYLYLCIHACCLSVCLNFHVGNNHLGGQDFNDRLMTYLQEQIAKDLGQVITDPEDLQVLRQTVEETKLQLTYHNDFLIKVPLHSIQSRRNQNALFVHRLTRETFNKINFDLFQKVLEPIDKILEVLEIPKDHIDEVVLVGGSTRIPKIRELVRNYFAKEPNTAIDPELAVASGVGIQAGILGGMWPLTVSATEIPSSVRKIHVH